MRASASSLHASAPTLRCPSAKESPMLIFTMRRAGRAAALAAGLIIAAACTDASGVGGNTADKSPPTIHLSKGGTTPDTVLAFQVEVKDNLGIKQIKVNVSG